MKVNQKKNNIISSEPQKTAPETLLTCFSQNLRTAQKTSILKTLGVHRWLPQDPAKQQVYLSHTAYANNSDDDNKKVIYCENCTQIMLGTETTPAKLCFIMEAPDKKDDEKNTAFTETAASLLNAMLQSVHLSREKRKITTLFKCRSTQDSNLLPEKTQACNHALKKQLKRIKPTCLIVFGETVGQTLLNTNTPFQALRQKKWACDIDNIPTFVTYHPTYLLQNPLEKRKAYEDWLLIAQHLSLLPIL